MLPVYLALLDDMDDIKRFEEIYEKYNVMMGKIALSILHNENDAFDATQNAFVAIAKHIKKFPDKANESYERAYVSIVTRHLSYNIYNKKSKEKNVVYLDMDKYYADHSFEDQIVEKDEIDRISKYIDGMSTIYRDVLFMNYLLDISAQDISNILETPENTVRSRLRRGIDQLRKLINSEAYNEKE